MLILLCFALLLIAPSEFLPNFVLVLTDDQDLLLNSLDFMNVTTRLVANKGLVFNNFFVNSPICCPSRSTILTGKYPHKLQVFNNSVDGGCSSVNWQQSHEKSTIASILKSVKNYKTFYAGKYLNQVYKQNPKKKYIERRSLCIRMCGICPTLNYGSKQVGGTQHVPPGYDWWIGLKGNSKYYNYTLSINGSAHSFKNAYLTDKITKYALDFLNQKSVVEGNFFMMLAPPACHAPFTPAPRHRDKFPNLKAPRSPPFNTTPVNKHWIVGMPPRHLPVNVTNLDSIYRNRIRTLLAVDDMVEKIIRKLKQIQAIQNTYIIVTSDNGFHIGQFTQPWDKRQPYESDIRAPFLIRGPKIRRKTVTGYPITAVDIAPTILDLAGVTDYSLDGASFKKQLFHKSDIYDGYHLIEYWGEGNAKSVDPACPWGPDNELAECALESWCKCQDSRNNTYTCLLRFSNEEKFKFCAFVDGFVEAYDLIRDPHELNNLELNQQQIRYYHSIIEHLKA